jgi:NAD(P)-dependent dehydrogenase (short-subunit alcohol dehydrogenase family)
MSEQVVLITGATGGFGPHVVKAFAAAGARVSLTGRKLEEAEAVAREAGLSDDRALPFAVDATNAASVAAWVGAVQQKWGRADVLVNIAGGYKSKALLDMEESDWDFMLNLNARSVFLTCKAVLPLMLAQKRGKIVNIGAKQALAAGRKSAGYAASKAAVLRLTEALSAEVREQGINVNAILPSTIDTPANRAGQPDADYGKWVSPEDLAAVILFLASDAANAIHGAQIPVYGKGG